MTDPGDMPTAVDDLSDFFEGFDIEMADMSAGDFSDPNESLVRPFGDDIAAAVNSAAWHTIIDGSGGEAFVDDLTVEHMRDAIERLQSNGFATECLTPTEIWGESSDRASGAAFFMGNDVADDFEDLKDGWERFDHPDGVGPDLTKFEGYLVERVEDGLPSHLAVLVDVDAIARVPPHARIVPMGMDSTPSVSSPVVVAHEDGITVINVAQQ